MTAHAVLYRIRMFHEGIRRMASLALLTEIAGRIARPRVRIVTGSAPKGVSAGLSATARRELLNMADHLELRCASHPAGLLVEVDRKHLFEFHSRLEVPE
jgi:hypothetical protein